MQEYELVDSGVEWMGNIPKHWCTKRIKDLVNLKSGDGITSLQIKKDGKYPVYGGNGIRGYFDSHTHDGARLLIGRQGALCGNIHHVEGKFFASEHAVVCTPYFPINIYWFEELLRIMNLNQYSNAAAQPGLAVDKIKRLKLPYPSPDEREAIANYLDKACKKIDKTISIKQQQLEKLEAHRKSVIHEAVTKGLDKNVAMKDSGVEWLGDIPQHWKVDRLKDISQLRDNKTSVKDNIEDYIELEDISQWTGKILNKRNTLEVSSDVMMFYKGDVLFGKLRPYLAKVVLAEFNGKCTGEILAIKPNRILSKFLSYYLLSKHFINHCNNFSYGAKMPRINWNTQMSMFPISIPPSDEQKVIESYLDDACEKIDETKDKIKLQIKKLTQYRQSLIHECVTGKKRIYQGDIN